MYLIFQAGVFNTHGPVLRSVGILRGLVFTYRSIIDKGNIHHRLEDAIFDFFWLVEPLHLLEEGGVKLLCFDTAG